MARLEFEQHCCWCPGGGRGQGVGRQVDVADVETLREMTDWGRNRLGSVVTVLGAVIDGKPNLVAAVTPDLVERGLKLGP